MVEWFYFNFLLRDARKLPTDKNYTPERARLGPVAGFNTPECNGEPPPGVRALLITLNPMPGKFDELIKPYQPYLHSIWLQTTFSPLGLFYCIAFVSQAWFIIFPNFLQNTC